MSINISYITFKYNFQHNCNHCRQHAIEYRYWSKDCFEWINLCMNQSWINQSSILDESILNEWINLKNDLFKATFSILMLVSFKDKKEISFISQQGLYHRIYYQFLCFSNVAQGSHNICFQSSLLHIFVFNLQSQTYHNISI